MAFGNEQARDQFRPSADPEFSEDIPQVKFDGLLAYQEPTPDLKVRHPFGTGQGNLRLSPAQIARARDPLDGFTECGYSLVSLYLFRIGEESERTTAFENLFGLENLVEAASSSPRSLLTLYGLRALDA